MFAKKLKNKTIEHISLKKLKSEDEQLFIDDIDRKILKLLLWDARLSYRAIARQAKLSPTTVIERLEKLKRSGVINGFFVNIDSKKLGLGLTAIIELVAPKLKLLGAMEVIRELPNVYAIYHTTGDIDAVIIAKFKTIDELRTFLGNLYDTMDIQRSETRIVLATVKEDFRVRV